MPRQSKTRPRDLTVVERRAYVFRLKQAGATFLDIMRTIHADAAWHGRLPKTYNERHVHRDVMIELQRQRRDLAEIVDDVRQQELARIDRLFLAYWQRALGDTQRHVPGDIEAGRFILQLMERRAKYLPGLNAPADVTLNIQALVAKVANDLGLDTAVLLAEAQALLMEGDSGQDA